MFKLIKEIWGFIRAILQFITEILEGMTEGLDKFNDEMNIKLSLSKLKRWQKVFDHQSDVINSSYPYTNEIMGELCKITQKSISTLTQVLSNPDIHKDFSLMIKEFKKEAAKVKQSKDYKNTLKYCKKEGLESLDDPVIIFDFYFKTKPIEEIESEAKSEKDLILLIKNFNQKIEIIKQRFGLVSDDVGRISEETKNKKYAKKENVSTQAKPREIEKTKLDLNGMKPDDNFKPTDSTDEYDKKVPWHQQPGNRKLQIEFVMDTVKAKMRGGSEKLSDKTQGFDLDEHAAKSFVKSITQELLKLNLEGHHDLRLSSTGSGKWYYTLRDYWSIGQKEEHGGLYVTYQEACSVARKKKGSVKREGEMWRVKID
jgi:hypothetical protein